MSVYATAIPKAAVEHGTVRPSLRRIAAGGTAKISVSVILIACLLVSGFMIYKLMPREGGRPSRWSESGETAMALGQFTLLVAGLAFLAKAIF